MIRLYAAPLQGFTDFRFRNVYQKHFTGVDSYLAPYIRLYKGEIKSANKRDVFPENNSGQPLVPQVITKDADEFLMVSEYVHSLGYKEINWNLGCPYPMVAKRGMGAGLLQTPGIIEQVLDTVSSRSDIKISIKMRLGYESPEEIFKVLPILNSYALEYVVIHPRIGKQLYKGEVDLPTFDRCLDLCEHTLIYNGDIDSVGAFQEMQLRYPQIQHWMIGRGLIADPFLPAMIKEGTSVYPGQWKETFRIFHEALFGLTEEALSGDKHVLMKMYQYWEYFIHLFPHEKKALKKIKKAKTVSEYSKLVGQLVQ